MSKFLKQPAAVYQILWDLQKQQQTPPLAGCSEHTPPPPLHLSIKIQPKNIPTKNKVKNNMNKL